MILVVEIPTHFEAAPGASQASLRTSELLLASAPLTRSWDNALSANPPEQKKQSYLNRGVDHVTSLVVRDKETRETVNHYVCEFTKTAALFARGKTGLFGSMIAYGLDQASPDSKPLEQLEDLALGAAKGGTLKTAFGAIGSNFSFAPTKGVLMGVAARSAEVVFDRQSLADPNRLYNRLQSEVGNKQSLMFDAAFMMAGEGLFGVANKMSAGTLAQNELKAGMVMGASFGVVNGSTSEFLGQIAAGKRWDEVDYKRVLFKGALDAGVGALGAGAGIKISDPAFQARVSRQLLNLKVNSFGDSQMREFVVTNGQQNLESLINDHSNQAQLKVREVSKLFGIEKLGPEKSMVVQHTPDEAKRIQPVPAGIDLLATCNPEKLPAELKGLHVFPGAKGDMTIEVGPQGGRLRVSTVDPRSRGINLMGRPAQLDKGVTINVMAPLVVGDPHNPTSDFSKHEWADFERQLAEAKKLGVDAVSTDIWWGLIEPKQGQYDFAYYDKVAGAITKAGLKWTPILSFHQCGGNVGDNVYVPVPEWVWSKLASQTGGDVNAAKFISEQGKASNEYVSFWATDKALPYYESVMRAFQSHFAGKAGSIAEINVSLGPSGEIRYPSYNSHDEGTGYPTRGGLQAYSKLAKESFKSFVLNKYGDMAGAEKAWGTKIGEIEPPRNVDSFLAKNMQHNTAYGRDLYDWYNQSLVNHGRMVMSKALNVFAQPDSAFTGIDLGAKIPGVHWRVGEWKGDQIVMSDRLAELNAGLIRSTADWTADYGGHGYGPIMSMFRELQGTRSRVVPHFTALEMVDGQDGPKVKSLPYTLARWVGREAVMQGLPIKGENALSFTLANDQAWDAMRSHLTLPGQDGYYSGLTFLRISDILNYPVANARISEMINAIKTATPAKAGK